MTELNGNPNKQNALGETPLHLVCQGDEIRIMCLANRERRAQCLNLLLQWHTDNEKCNLASVDSVSKFYFVFKCLFILKYLHSKFLTAA